MAANLWSIAQEAGGRTEIGRELELKLSETTLNSVIQGRVLWEIY